MTETKRDYEVGRGKPPIHTRFNKGQSGNPRGPRPKNLPALLAEALNHILSMRSRRRALRVLAMPRPSRGLSSRRLPATCQLARSCATI